MRSYNKTLYALITILVIYTVSFVAFIMYSITNFAFSDFYKRLDLRRNLAAEQMWNGKENRADWSLTYVEELNNQRAFIVEFDEKANIINNSGFNAYLWEKVDKQGEANFKEGNTFYSTKFYRQQGKNYIVGVSAENYFYTHHLHYLQNLLLIALVLGVLFVIVVSLLVKGSFIKPIHGLIDEVKKIGSENLYLRLSEEKHKGVLHKLANTFNRMLNRVETSFETQKNFIGNASHELNTPLTSIIGIADLALSKERTVEEYKQAMQKIVDAAGNLERKTNALLLLARTGYEKNNKLNFKPVRIDQIIMDAEMTVKAINERFHIKTDFSMLPDDSMKLKVNGLAPLLQLAISNVVSNACKYSPDHTAYVALGAFENGVLILIRDEGIGIPEKELSYIYDPYFRASNTQNFSGYGIGLPLARNIIKMHDGELSVASTLGKGTTVRIELPTYSPI
ncbi:HAMP domain-containing sensor histidine kinase [Sphingobacterium corticibacterium]|uniref:histidine kinase n=1 Tax=Sphingobacterium corticibacterium TaxID=2484746 RepID=A0A4Q6XHP7_9SPHI|nr:HAMP domain-containing sensor histidine kinase [Sphingobacterium corticibacterium]RZF59451.1 HAMP domain-containing histidine kinase [Sphingobacterium corticibacterium]